jgi:hypothetical protein
MKWDDNNNVCGWAIQESLNDSGVSHSIEKLIPSAKKPLTNKKVCSLSL